MLWLYLIPTWVLGVLIIGTTILLSVLGFLALSPLIRKYPHPGNEMVYCFIGTTSVIYALVLGLFAVATWDSLKSVEDLAMHEALQAGKIYWDLSGYAKADRDRLRPMIKTYLHTVIEQEWPQQRRGIKAPDPQVLFDLINGWTTVEPVTEGQKLIHGEALHQLNELLSYRRARREAVNDQLPTSLWTVVLFGGVLNIGMSYLIVTDRTVMHVVLVTTLAAMIGLMIFVIVAVDHPLWGGVSVSPDSYIEVLNTISQKAAVLQ